MDETGNHHSRDMHEIWCRDSDWGTSLGRSIPCPPAFCSMRKIHLRPQVLRPTSPRNISPISNPKRRGNNTFGFGTGFEMRIEFRAALII
ncbi:embryonic stem cell-related gene protein-like [Pan troglodytes]|uniref:embryonic stem cell-related gene protein-like n=1 Tax=Pan troglodytes TaxID=9598 RepID=UPI00301382F7